MSCEIQPLRQDDLIGLSQFLTAGFHTPSDAEFAAPDVLAWKYLEARGGPDDELPRSLLARDEAATIAGHVGLCRTCFQGLNLPTEGVPTLHMIDWLGSPGQRSVGASLMRRAHESTPTQFGLGGSRAGRAVITRAGYQPREPVPVYQRVLRPSHWLRVGGLSAWSRALRLARDVVTPSGALERFQQPRRTLRPRRIVSFGAEIEPIAIAAGKSAILTDRTPARLNHFLRFPRQSFSGWHLVGPDDQVVGFAILNILPQHDGRVRLGKIVDCLLMKPDVALWQAAIQVLTKELARQGADIAQTFGSTPWMAEALQKASYRSRFALDFSLRDPSQRIPDQATFHLMPIEADYAYT